MRYDPSLDGIRAIAVIPVLMFHAAIPLGKAGFLGVDIFFVLSGYLITRILSEEYNRSGTIHVIPFYIRRARRLYPALLLFLLGYLSIAWIFWPNWPHHLRDAILSALYVQDYAKSFNYNPQVLSHIWSLSIEEHFYLVWPLALLALLRLRSRNIVYVLIGAWVLATLWRYSEIHRIQRDWWRVYNRFDTHATGLILGTLLGILNFRGSRAWFLGGLAILLFVAATFHHGQRQTAIYGFSLTELGAACLIIGRQPSLGHPILAWIGRMSYGFYLWHYLLIRVCRVYKIGWEWKFLIGGIGGMALAALSFYTVEVYFRAKRPEIEESQPAAGDSSFDNTKAKP